MNQDYVHGSTLPQVSPKFDCGEVGEHERQEGHAVKDKMRRAVIYTARKTRRYPIEFVDTIGGNTIRKSFNRS